MTDIDDTLAETVPDIQGSVPLPPPREPALPFHYPPKRPTPPPCKSLNKTIVGGFAAHLDSTVPIGVPALTEPPIAEPLTPQQRLARAVREVRACVDAAVPDKPGGKALRDAYGILHLLRERLSIGDATVDIYDLIVRWHRMDNTGPPRTS